MSAITIRGLTDDVHDGLRALASARGVSVEALVRGVLAEAANPPEGKSDGTSEGKQVMGMSEMQQRWQGPEPDGVLHEMPDLWGALRGTVRVAPGVDLAAPLGEDWKAEA